MKKQSDIAMAILPHNKKCCEYDTAMADFDKRAEATLLSAIRAQGVSLPKESEGKDYASVYGCYANNDNAGRTLNANNAFSNSNDNYAGALAEYLEKDGKENLTSQPTRLKNENENHIANGGYGQREYDLPYWGESAESDANCAEETKEIWRELEKANRKRNLKNLKRFYQSKPIVEYAVRRCCKDRDTRQKEWYYSHASKIADEIITDIKSNTYTVGKCKDRVIKASHSTGKNRNAKVFSLYDRCVQMLALTVIEQKLKRKVVRNNYSNIEGRGIYCKDRRYCMANRIRTAVNNHKDKWVLLTDIRKFYESVDWKVMLGVVMETIKDPTTINIIAQTLKESRGLPIGSCLSPLFADILMNNYDHIVLTKFKPNFFAAFGDNRMMIASKQLCIEIQQFAKSYYEGAYGLHLKGDYQIKPVDAGFSFCKKQFSVGYVRERGEIRRRAIKVALKPQRFAGYKGLFLMTDSRHLLYLITNNLDAMKSRRGIEIQPFRGIARDFNEFVGKRICITNYKRVENHKESGYYYLFQIIDKDADGKMRLCKSQNGSFEIKEAGDLWVREDIKAPIYVTVKKEGRSFYFEEYHTTEQEACEALINGYNIKL